MINKSWPIIVFVVFNLIVSCRDGLESNSATPASLLKVNTTPPAPDTTPPTVVSWSPTGGGVSLTPTIRVRFSEPMDPLTIDSSTFLLTDELSMPITGTISYISITRTAQFVPDSQLSYYSDYTAQVTMGVTDVAGNTLDQNYTWTFTTVAQGTVGAPSFSPTPPYTEVGALDVTLDGDTGSTIIYTIGTIVTPPPDPDPLTPIGTTCPPGTIITLTSNTTIKALAFRDGWVNSAIMTGVYTLKAPQPTISPTTSVTYAPGLTVTIDDPGYSIRYRINGGTEIDTSPPASFIINTSSSITAYAYIPGMDDSDITTATYAIDGTGPIVVLPTTPADDAYSVNTGSPIVITFNEEIDSGTVYVNTANNSCSVGTIQVSWDNFNNNTCAKFNNGVSPDVTKTIFTINPSSGELDFGTFYKIKVTTGVKDAYGNSMATEYAMTNGFLTDTMGVPDASFDSDGVATTALLGTDYGRAITVQPNNRIVVAGETGTYYGLVRYLPDGSLDTGEFQSPNGIFTDDFGGTSICTSVGILPANGTIVVAGHWYNGTDFNFGLAGYKMIDGYLDSMLNKKSYDLRLTGNDDQAYALAVDAMERFVVVGSSSNGSNDEFAVTRFMPDGTFDGSFNGGKIFEQFAPAVNNVAHAVAIDPGVNPSDPMDDRIITAGWFGFLANQNRFAIACYDNNGNLDTSFNGTGKRSENFGFGGNDEAYAVAVQSDHKIIVAGNTETAPLSSIYDFALVRYNTDGSIDTSFNGGKVTLDIGGYDRLTAIAIQRDGKIVVAGYTDTGTNPNNIVLVRLNSDGTLDSSFGPPTFTGIIITDLTAQPDIGTAMVLQPNGRIVITGATNNGGDWDYLVMRYK